MVGVQRQHDKWPWTDKVRKSNPSKPRLGYDDLKAALIYPKLRFTTTSPSELLVIMMMLIVNSTK